MTCSASPPELFSALSKAVILLMYYALPPACIGNCSKTDIPEAGLIDIISVSLLARLTNCDSHVQNISTLPRCLGND